MVGETPNLAARLQAEATPGTIAIDITTRRLLGGLFEYRDLGGIEAKGFANRVQAYEVVRPSMVESRFEAAPHRNNATGRPRRGGRSPPAPLGAGEGWRRVRGANLGRARYRQVAHR